ncbi:MAG: hypothetical protein V7641_4282 [Blastocatellia bacterium]
MQDNKKIKGFEKEREYLENLLNSRFNFYLVFVSLFLGAVLDKDSIILEKQRITLLFGGGLVSLLISVAVLRTNILVNRALNWLENEENAPDNAWRIISEDPIRGIPLRANWFLVGASILITIIFFVLAIWQFIYGAR